MAESSRITVIADLPQNLQHSLEIVSGSLATLVTGILVVLGKIGTNPIAWFAVGIFIFAPTLLATASVYMAFRRLWLGSLTNLGLVCFCVLGYWGIYEIFGWLVDQPWYPFR